MSAPFAVSRSRLPKAARSWPFKQDDRGRDKPGHGRLGSGDQLFALSDGMIDFEKDGEKRSDYDFFFNKIKSGAGNNDTFKTIKDETFSVEKSKELIDDCSLIFIQKN